VRGLISQWKARSQPDARNMPAGSLPAPDMLPRGVESIQGRTDDRKRPKDVTAAPWRPMVCFRIFIPGADKPGTGSGVLIAPNVVLTAAHNLHMLADQRGRGFDPPKITAHVGVVSHDVGTARAFVTRVATCPGYVESSRNDDVRYNFDFGLAWLSDDSLFKWAQTSFNVPAHAPLADAVVLEAQLTAAGYPDEPGKRIELKFHSERQHVTSCAPTTFRYKLDTEGGQSGGPVFRYHAADGACYLAGVHVAGGGSSNMARRYDASMQKQVKAWLDAPNAGRRLSITS
jgi:V8-like Glu-specific endopeptidase